MGLCGSSAASKVAALDEPHSAVSPALTTESRKTDKAELAVSSAGSGGVRDAVGLSVACTDRQYERIKWRKGDLIGSGANGRVYLGLEEETGAIIAVKEMLFSSAVQDREELEAMQEEIEVLRHAPQRAH